MKTRSWLRTKLSQTSTKHSGCLLLSKQTKHKQKQKHKVSTPKVPSQRRSTHLEPNFHTNLIAPDVLRRNLFNILTTGLATVAKQRANFLREMTELKKTLIVEESKLRGTMSKSVSSVTEEKALVLWRELLKAALFEDWEIVAHHLEKGVDLVGLEVESKLHAKKLQPPMMTPEQLIGQSTWQRKAMIARPPTEEEIEQADLLHEECEKCENHVRELRTFFTLSKSHASNVYFFCETLSLPQDFQ